MNSMTAQQMWDKLSKEMQGTHTGAPQPNSDWSKFVLSHKGFTLRDIQVGQIPTAVKSNGMSQANIEKYKQADTSQFPPMVIGNDGYILDGNHRLQAYKHQGIKTVKAYIGENKMDLKLIDQELSEARLFRGTRKFSTLDGKDVANLLYLNTIALFIFSMDDKQSGYGRDYARATVQYSTYSLFRTHATDLYMLAYQILHPSNDYVKMRNEIASKAFLNRLNFQDRKHIEFLRKIVIGKADPSEAQSYLFRLESQLDIRDGRYKRWRRMVLDWKRLKDLQKSMLLRQIGQEMSRIGNSTGRTSEVLITFNQMYKYKKYTNSAEKKDVIRRVSPTSVQPDKKRAGGIKRIADYWASRTKK